jgi:hypothetical protein
VVGYRYDFAGTLKVSTKVDDKTYVGTIGESYSGIQQGDVVVNYLSTKRSVENLRPLNSGSSIDATIVDMGIHSQQFGGEGAIVYLDRGGLNVGGTYSVFQKIFDTPASATETSTDKEALKGIGMLKVIDSNEKIAIAVVIQSSSEIRIGDKLIPR